MAPPAPRRPGPAEKVAEVYAGYEQAQEPPPSCSTSTTCCCTPRRGLEEHPASPQEFRARYRRFVVDEYQDVNPPQQRLLDAWLGEPDDLTVVGDANQTIYSFAGATSPYLIDFPRRSPRRPWSGWSRLPVHPAGGLAATR